MHYAIYLSICIYKHSSESWGLLKSTIDMYSAQVSRPQEKDFGPPVSQVSPASFEEKMTVVKPSEVMNFFQLHRLTPFETHHSACGSNIYACA
jgi:hypothetical protein